MSPLFFDFPRPSALGESLRGLLGAEQGKFILKTFPDGETYLRIENPVEGCHVIVNACLVPPNEVTLSLCFLSDALRAQGAKSVGLFAPYLPYMRQDKVFHPGEALTSRTFAQLISTYFHYLVTVDPHLHRYHSLDEIYSIPTSVVQAAPLLQEWIHATLPSPFLIGPDAESVQWVKEIAGASPFIVLQKERYADGHVKINWPETLSFEGKTPVLIDDIISSGGTMVQAVEHLKTLTPTPPVCLVIHPIFAEHSYQDLLKSGVECIVSCNSLPHPSNQLDLAPLVLPALTYFLEKFS
jgi:ribose-phosphate pyrophosphokinase